VELNLKQWHTYYTLDQAAQAISDQNILELRTLIKDLEMDQAIMEDLSKGINAWRQNKEPRCSPNWVNYKHLYPGIISASMGSWQSRGQCTKPTTMQINSYEI